MKENTRDNDKVTAQHWMILVALGLFTFMSTLDSSIVNIALPTLSRELGVATSHATWTVAIYLITISGLLILFGRLGDIYGKIRIFKIGTYIFTLGSLLAGINMTRFGLGLQFLLFARVVQAIGGAMTMSNSFGITTETFPVRVRARAMSYIGIFVSLGSVTGPGVGGLILQVLPWSYIFWINVPIGIFAIVMGQRLFPKTPKVPKESKMSKQIDYLGTLLFFLTIVCLFLGVELGQTMGFAHYTVISLIVASVIFFILFLYQETRMHETPEQAPIIELTMFKNQLFSLSLIAAMCIFICNFFAAIIMPFYLQNYLGWSPGKAGMIMMVFPITMLIISPIGGYLGDHFNKELVTAIGIAIVVASQLGYTRFHAGSSIFTLCAFTALNALGSSLFQSSNNAIIMGSVEKKYLGIAGSINALARNLGMISGITIATTILFFSMSKLVGHRVNTYLHEQPEIFLTSMHVAFYVSLGIALMTLCLVLYRLITATVRQRRKSL
ncbi:MAG: MFS transporter [Clostridiales Family XIII bacterium]|jgi:EmrB/QacA subfamily drug resistance transporter|nr:MFS transporter [Clostridiales Family XIII bacterium]